MGNSQAAFSEEQAIETYFYYLPVLHNGSPIVVNSIEDELIDDGFCTLREAVIAANTNTASGIYKGECQAGSDSRTDVIKLEMDSVYSLTIDRVNDDPAAYNGDLNILDNTAALDLVITCGRDESCTISQDALLDDRVILIEGASVALYGLVITGGTTPYSGGGIAVSEGELAFWNGRITGNSAVSGGGIASDGAVHVYSSAVTENDVSWTGGAIINAMGAPFYVDDTIISMNTALDGGGGGISNLGLMYLSNSNLSGNISVNNDGGGIANSGSLTISHCTFYGNIAETSGGGALANLVGATATIQEGSMVGSGPSIGESNRASTGGGLFNYGTLNVYESTVRGNQAVFGAGLSNWAGTITLNDTDVISNTSIYDGGGIHNKGNASLFVENGSSISNNAAGGQGGGLSNWEYGTVAITESIISFNTASAGGGIHFEGTPSSMILDGTSVIGNQATNDAGGILIMTDAEVTIRNNSIISQNSASYGGGIANWGGTLTIDASQVNQNDCTNSGGGLVNKDGGTAVIQNNSLIDGNTAQWEGGISNWGASNLTIMNSTISGNTANASAGGLGNLGTATLIDVEFYTNNAPWGGAILNAEGGVLDIASSIISNNTTVNEGGGIGNNGTLTLSGSTVSSNSAGTLGGGLAIWDTGITTITGSIFLNNTATTSGGAIYIYPTLTSVLSITGSCIDGNTDTALFNDQAFLQIATGNWWGDPSGPSGAGPGSGDSVSLYVDFSGWLAAPPAICAP
jgi:CSLREA domain-containing protein